MNPEEVTRTDPASLAERFFLSRGRILANRYEVRELLGCGGMGEVWLAYDLKLRMEVALKAMRPEKFTGEKGREILRREVRNARGVISPNVCRVFDLFESDGGELVSMEYVNGMTLQQILQDRGPLELKEAQEIASQFLAGLEEIHRAGLVHRDLKPSNIMVTRTGRVVVMDFGLAWAVEEIPGKISRNILGTPAYMAPEQLAGGRIDARTDVFSAGVVLVEMVSPDGIRSEESRRALWEAIRADPTRLPKTPWSPVLQKAVARDAEERYASAGELLRALEEVTLRVAGAEHLHPYPGLAAFTEKDAEYFFGREAEIEQIWRKLDQPRLHALIGPSGAGKSSFLHAGVMAAAPAGWRIILATPGTRPFRSLAQALLPDMHSAADAAELLRFEEPDVAVSLFSRWRRTHPHVLVIVDQFEELFTLNPEEVQEQFATVLSRLVLEADVHVLLSMRDDFLFHCHRLEALNPVFSELTALGPPTGAALRRALVQPALRCGYHFEDESLVDQILAEVEGERGALPLMAFAVSQLWQKRDRERGLLTREAYEEIGGVAGALAQHAEITIERIGTEQISVVRELLRNLFTAQGTRVSRDRSELLSVFPGQDREKAAKVLDSLFAARLLTSYEVLDESAGEPTCQRVEIVHESLLSKWPRLVRWQTQDAEGAQLRDDLRQAAHLWDHHERSEDFLWTGTAYQEYQLWRQRYSGALTPLEESFVEAATKLAGRKRTRRRIAVSSIVALALVIAVVTSLLWRKAEKDARRAEAAGLLSLGRLKLDDNPTAALAYALASLERLDFAAARRFALEVLWRGGAAIVIPVELQSIEFSADGRWLVTGGVGGGVQLWSRDGGPPKVVRKGDGRMQEVQFGPASDRLVLKSGDRTVRILSVPDLRELRKVDFNTHVWVNVRGSGVFMISEDPVDAQPVHWYPLDGGEGQFLGRWDPTGDTSADISRDGQWLAEVRGRTLHVRPLSNLSVPRRKIGEHRSNISCFADAGDDRWLAVDESGQLRIWPIHAPAAHQPIQLEPGTNRVARDADGSTLVIARGGGLRTSQIASVWDLTGPPDADPGVLSYGDAGFLHSLSIERSGDWLAASLNDFAILWPLRQPLSRVIHGEAAPWIQVAFTPDGKWLVSSSQARGGARLWPLSPGVGPKQAIGMPGRDGISGVAVHPSGRHLLTSVWFTGQPVLIPLDGGPTRILPGISRGVVEPPAFSADGRLAAAATRGPAKPHIYVWNLQTGNVTVLDPRGGHEPAGGSQEDWEGVVWEVEFTSDGRLVSAGTSGLRLWDLSQRTSTLLKPTTGAVRSILAGSSADRFLLAEIDITKRTSTVTFHDLRSKTTRQLTAHGNRVQAVALDRTGTIAVTGDFDGVVRVGPVSGEEPHLLFGHRQEISSVAVSPDGRWIASGSQDGTIRLWPMPDLYKPPLHMLPYEQLVAKLRSLTNLRVIEDSASGTGYKIEIGPFPGWKQLPEW